MILRATFRNSNLLSELLQYGVDQIERLVDFRPNFSARQHDFAGDEDQQHDSRFDHTVDEAGEQFGFVAAELTVQQH